MTNQKTLKFIHECKFSDIFGPTAYEVSINKSNIQHTKPEPFIQKTNDNKINTKIKQEDLILIDMICSKLDINRSQLLNRLVNNIIENELNQISTKYKDARLLLADTADANTSYANENIPWKFTLFDSEIDFIHNNIAQWNCIEQQQPGDPSVPESCSNNSPYYYGLKEKLNDYK